MPRRVFRTVPDEMLEHAERVAQHFEGLGYVVTVEGAELGFPYTPTLLCKRQRTILIVELVPSIPLEKIRTWVSYAKSSGQDTRLAIAVLPASAPSLELEDVLRGLRVGCYIVGDHVDERLPPADLGLNVDLPELANLPPKVRAALGDAYEQFSRSHWREGFETACQAFEVEARRYLMAGVRNNRIKIVGPRGVMNLTQKQIHGMTMGQLADRYAKIQNPNYSDGLIGKTLKSINQDRIGVVHHRTRKWTENRLRKNVGRHMWSLVEAMKHTMK